MRFWWNRFWSDRDALRAAAGEVFLVSLLSLLPLLLLPLIDQLKGQPEGRLLLSPLLIAAVGAGQLYLYSFTLFGTLFWLTLKEHRNLERFEPRKWLMLLVLIPMFIILGVYLYDPALSKPLSDTLVIASVIVYVMYILLYYVLKVFDNLRAPTVSTELAEGSAELVDRYRNIAED